jgi:hypothetical protein
MAGEGPGCSLIRARSLPVRMFSGCARVYHRCPVLGLECPSDAVSAHGLPRIRSQSKGWALVQMRSKLSR